MGAEIGTLELEFVARGEKLEAQMSAIRRDVELAFKDLDQRVRKAGGGFDAIPTGAKKAGAAMNSLQGQTANMAAQFQDIAVQLQGGGSPFTVALQQGTQLGAILSGAGSVNGAVRGLGAAFMSVLSPVNLVTIGLIAAGGAAVQYFMNKSDADKLTEALKQQPDIIRSIKDAWGGAAKGIETYNQESKNVVLANVDELAKTYREGIAVAAKDAAAALENGLGDLRVDVTGLAMPELANLGDQVDVKGIEALKSALADLTESGDILKLRDAMGALATSADVSDDVKDLANSLLKSTKTAGDAAAALRDLTSAKTQLTEATTVMIVETKRFNDLLSQGAYNEAAQHAQTLGQALTAAAAAQKALNAETNRFAAERLANAGQGYEALNDYYTREKAGISGEAFSPTSGILDLISQAEGTKNRRGYNETLDYGRWTGGNRNLTMMTLDEIDTLQSGMLANPNNRALYGNGRGSSALGMYQFTRETLRDLRSSLGIKGNEYFSPDMQDRLASELVRRSGGDVSKLQGRWEGLKKVDSSVISTAYSNSSLTMPGQDQAVAQRARSYDDMIKSGEAYIAEQKSEASTVGLTALAAAKLSYEHRMLAEAQRLQIELTPKQTEEISALADRMAQADVEAQKLAQSHKQLVDAQQFLAESASNAFIDMIVNGRSASDVMASLAKTIASAALQAVFLGEGPLAGLFGGGKSADGSASGLFGKLFSWLIPSAKGNVFQSAGLHAYSNSVVSKPTTFAFARGAGLMGEAGPEAIMPLRRDASGRLGVMAAGGGSSGGGSVVFGDIHVSVPEGTSPKEAALWGNEMRRQLGILVDERIADQTRSGGLISKGPF